jgi:DNA-binding transcriptional ArsR family regulator
VCAAGRPEDSRPVARPMGEQPPGPWSGMLASLSSNPGFVLAVRSVLAALAPLDFVFNMPNMKSFEAAPQRTEEDLESAAALLAALSHPVRLRIVEGLLRGECCVGTIVGCLDLPQPLVSRHLAVLRDAGVLLAEADGRKRNYRVVDPRAEHLLRCLWAQDGSCQDCP